MLHKVSSLLICGGKKKNHHLNWLKCFNILLIESLKLMHIKAKWWAILKLLLHNLQWYLLIVGFLWFYCLFIFLIHHHSCKFFLKTKALLFNTNRFFPLHCLCTNHDHRLIDWLIDFWLIIIREYFFLGTK